MTGGASLFFGFPKGKRACFHFGWPTFVAGLGGAGLELEEGPEVDGSGMVIADILCHTQVGTRIGLLGNQS